MQARHYQTPSFYATIQLVSQRAFKKAKLPRTSKKFQVQRLLIIEGRHKIINWPCDFNLKTHNALTRSRLISQWEARVTNRYSRKVDDEGFVDFPLRIDCQSYAWRERPFLLIRYGRASRARKAQTCHTRLAPLRHLRQLRVGQLHGGQSPHAFAELAVDLSINIINGIISLGLLLRLRLIAGDDAAVVLLRQRSYLIRTVYETRQREVRGNFTLCKKAILRAVSFHRYFFSLPGNCSFTFSIFMISSALSLSTGMALIVTADWQTK